MSHHRNMYQNFNKLSKCPEKKHLQKMTKSIKIHIYGSNNNSNNHHLIMKLRTKYDKVCSKNMNTINPNYLAKMEIIIMVMKMIASKNCY